jgi:hypothetical protein
MNGKAFALEGGGQRLSTNEPAETEQQGRNVEARIFAGGAVRRREEPSAEALLTAFQDGEFFIPIRIGDLDELCPNEELVSMHGRGEQGRRIPCPERRAHGHKYA